MVMYTHYIRLDSEDWIIKGFSTAHEQPQEGDIAITGEGEGSYQFRLFEGGEENPNLYYSFNQPKYKFNRITNEITEQIKPLADSFKLMEIKVVRDKLLLDSDKLMLSDRFSILTNEEQTAVLTYRQELRDMPSNPNLDLDNPVYPTKPVLSLTW